MPPLENDRELKGKQKITERQQAGNPPNLQSSLHALSDCNILAGKGRGKQEAVYDDDEEEYDPRQVYLLARSPY